MKREVMIGLLLGAIAAGSFASESDGIYSFKVGQFEVYMLVESESEGSTRIIPTADAALIKRYIPETGFKSSTNVFLIKAPGHNILVDTGFGRTIFEKMKTLGIEPDQIDTVLITHLHGDHIGGLQRDGRPVFPNAKIYLSEKEHTYFTKTQVNQGAVTALAPYGSKVVTFEPGILGGAAREILPGISAIANYGHTPGHTVYMLENGGARLIIAGDFLHVALVQIPNPDISATYDVDQSAAAASRRQILDYAARNKILIGGMHMVYPAVGTVEADGSGFRFTPEIK
jgi:glyoxylase-like metal-dependent hydrolase (beta-lactamase superfamily II)